MIEISFRSRQLQHARWIGKIISLNALSGTAVILTNAAIAYHFGTSHLVETYFAASFLLVIVFKLTQTGVLAEVLVPSIVKHRLEGAEEFSAYVASLLNVFASSTGAVVLTLALAAPLLTRIAVPGFSPDQRWAVTCTVWALLPTLVLTALASPLASVLQTCRCFGQPEFAKAAANFLQLIVVVLLGPSLGISALVLGQWAFSLTYCGMLCVALRRKGYRHRWRCLLDASDLTRLRRAFMSCAAYAGCSQFLFWGTSALLSVLPAGSYAVFQYGYRMASYIVGGVFVPALTISYVELSAEYAKGDLCRLGASIGRAIRIMAIVAVPAAATLVVLAPSLIFLLCEAGRFRSADTAAVGCVFALFSMGSPWVLFSTVLRRVLILTDSLWFVNVATLGFGILNLGLGYVLAQSQQGGAVGLAASYLVGSVGLTAVFYLRISFGGNAIAPQVPWGQLARVALLGTAVTVLGFYLRPYLLPVGSVRSVPAAMRIILGQVLVASTMALAYTMGTLLTGVLSLGSIVSFISKNRAVSALNSMKSTWHS